MDKCIRIAVPALRNINYFKHGGRFHKEKLERYIKFYCMRDAVAVLAFRCFYSKRKH